jgi:general stress protein YciG
MENRKPRGFAKMDPERQREIARKGGVASHEQGKAHEFTADEAKIAGRKGGDAVSKNRQWMRDIGRIGGKASGTQRARKKVESQEAAAALLKVLDPG